LKERNWEKHNSSLSLSLSLSLSFAETQMENSRKQHDFDDIMILMIFFLFAHEIVFEEKCFLGGNFFEFSLDLSGKLLNKNTTTSVVKKKNLEFQNPSRNRTL
jgi:hypothetical protein